MKPNKGKKPKLTFYLLYIYIYIYTWNFWISSNGDTDGISYILMKVIVLSTAAVMRYKSRGVPLLFMNLSVLNFSPNVQ